MSDESASSPAPKAPPSYPVGLHKTRAGRLLCVCGSESMPGAAVLTVRAAQRAGAGLVTLTAFSSAVQLLVASAAPEAIYLDLSDSQDLFVGRLPSEISGHQHDVRVVGPGLGVTGRTRELVRRLMSDEFDGPMVLDADGLNLVGASPEVCCGHKGTLVMTPHPGEASRLLEMEIPESTEGRICCARELATRSCSICVLKGSDTIVTDGEQTYINSTGNPGMATAGSGDVLAGIVGAYLGQLKVNAQDEWTPFDATCSAVYVHGLAGDLAARERGQRGLVASDLIEFLPAAQLAVELG